MSYLWGVIIPLGITSFMLCEPPGKELKYSNGASIKVKSQWWKKFIYYILAWVPWYSCIVIRFSLHSVTIPCNVKRIEEDTFLIAPPW